MARRLSWSDVRGGVVALVAIVAVAIGVLKYARVGALRGRTFRVYALVGEARGVLNGSEVWLSGQKVGRIVDIRFRAPENSDTTRRILIEMELLERHRPALHRDAAAQIRAGGSVIGPAVVYLSPGTMRATILRDGDTVLAHPQGDLEEATAQFGTAAKELPAIMANVKVLTAQLQTTEGTMGAIMNGPGLRELRGARVHVLGLGNRLAGGGTAGLVMRGGLTVRAGRVMARADSVRALLASPNSSFGRFRRDSTLLAEVSDIRNELTLVRADLDGSRGTAGRALHDSALTDALGEAERQMTLLFADLKKHPLRYISF
jgi:phospholipid/cholesterol/gamma-HCH transport system substrate-binding protein